MNAERNSYFKELASNLRYEGFTVGSETDGLLPVELNGQRLCLATESGGVRYREEDITDDSRRTALDRVTTVARTISEYMSQMAAAPQPTASGLEGDYRVLADFNDIVLAGHPTQYGHQFVTWERVQNRTALHQGDYYGPGAGADCYASAKRDFAVRSGLVPGDALFSPEQLTEVYRSIHEALDSGYPITDERQKCLESAAEQIERNVPDLVARADQSNQKEVEPASMEAADGGGMKFC